MMNRPFPLLLVPILVACAKPSAPATQSPIAVPTDVPSPTPPPSPTPLVEPREGRIFTYFGCDPTEPIVPRGPSSRWDGRYIYPGGMLHHEGLFHMFRNGFKVWPGLVSVAI